VRSNDRHRGGQRKGQAPNKNARAAKAQKYKETTRHCEDIKKEPVASTQDAFRTVT
jgi:hypothetical protein